MVNLRGVAGTVVTCLLAIGCGPASQGEGTGGSDASAGTASGGGARADGGAPGQGGGSGSGSGGSAGAGETGGVGAGTGGTEASDGYIGKLQVIRTVTPPTAPRVSADLDFVEQAAWDARPSSDPCLRETHGSCVVTQCPFSDEMEPDPATLPSSELLDAGTISLTADEGSFIATGKPTLADHGYTFESTGSLSGAELVKIEATGGTIPAFTSTIQFPFAPLLLTPSVQGTPGAADVSLPRVADYTFTWDARGASDRLQTILQFPVPTEPVTAPSPLVYCQFDAAAGTGTFPAAVLSKLPVGTRIRLFGIKTADIETSAGTVGVLAAFELISADKMSYPSFVIE